MNTNKIHAILFNNIFNNACFIFPLLKYCTVSNEYAENVVYPPKKPVIINNLYFKFIVYLSNILIKKPINNAPIQLTKNVPKGKFILKDEFIKLPDKYLNNAPIPPPIIINKYSIKYTAIVTRPY